MLGSQQQQIVRSPEARMLDHAQCAATARMLEARLKREHFAQSQREPPRNRHVLLRFTNRTIARFENRVQLVPVLRR